MEGKGHEPIDTHIPAKRRYEMMRILLEGPRTDKQLLMSPAVAEGSLGYGTPFEGMAHDQFLQLAAEVNAILDPVEVRSEEHTSELQSLMRISYAVFCLKNKTKHKQT